ncbi:cryptochrome/photolyase family protein [Paenibacillus sp. CMAA1364]
MILFIHRKDLRVDHLPAFDAIRFAQAPSLHVFILDPFLLSDDRATEHSGANFLQHVAVLQQQYTNHGKHLHVLYGNPTQIVDQLLSHHPIDEIIIHADYTPYALKRDLELQNTATSHGVKLTSYDDGMLVDLHDFVDWSGRAEPYKVFTPFYRRLRTYMEERPRPSFTAKLKDLQTVEIANPISSAFPISGEIHSLLEEHKNDVSDSNHEMPIACLEIFLDEGVQHYSNHRDQYAIDGTSQLSRHLNVGALSVRDVYDKLMDSEVDGESWLRQLAWRDFYIYQSRLNPDYFSYENQFDFSELSTQHFHSWSTGHTGIPLIDAAMRQLNATGWMPNRLRMITAMFLTKNLGCPFIYGERYFRLKLRDYDNVLNRGGWLWSSSLGYDSSPYFRVMNPVTQSQTHDPNGIYIRRWMPELAHLSSKEIHLPQPESLVDLKRSRALAIETYKRILDSKKRNEE